MAEKSKSSKNDSHVAGRGKTVGVYDRPPQKRNLKPMLIAIVIALALLLTVIFLRFSHGSSGEGLRGATSAVNSAMGDQDAREDLPQRADLFTRPLEGMVPAENGRHAILSQCVETVPPPAARV